MTVDDFREPKEFAFLQRIVGWGTLFIVLLSALGLGANRPVYWTLLAMGLVPLFCLQILHDLIMGVPRVALRLWLPAILFLGVLVWAALQALPVPYPSLAHPFWAEVPGGVPRISADPLQGHQHIIRLAAYGMVFWMIMRAAINVDRALNFFKMIALWSTGMAIFALVALATGENPILGDFASYAASASFINRNSYATYAVFGLMANLIIYANVHQTAAYGSDNLRRMLRDFLERFFGGGWIYALGILVCMAALVATQSRAGGVAGLLALVTFVVAHRRNEQGRGALIWLPVILLLIFVITALSSGLATRFMALSTDNLRFVVYPEIVAAIMDRPLLGHGLGAFQNVFRSYVPLEAAAAEFDLAHNSYLENAFELGLPAAAAFYLALFWVFGVIARGSVVRKQFRSFSCVALACMVAAGFHSAVDFSLQMPSTAALFAAILGIGWAHAWPKSSFEAKSRPRRASPTGSSVPPGTPAAMSAGTGAE